jgi:hypothetical protein
VWIDAISRIEVDPMHDADVRSARNAGASWSSLQAISDSASIRILMKSARSAV